MNPTESTLPVSPSWRVHIVVAFVSCSLLSYQIALIQILSLAQWHHFAHLVISLALLGFGVSGTLLALFRESLLRRCADLLFVLPLATGVCMVLSFVASQDLVGGFDPYLLFVRPREFLPLLFTCLLFLLPFLPGAMLIGLVLTAWTKRAGSLYFGNMAGSGAGALLAVGFAWIFLPGQLPGINAFLPVAAAMLLPPRWSRPRVSIVSLAALAMVLFVTLFPPEIRLSQYKDLQKALDLPGSRITHRLPGPQGVLHVVSSPALRFAPGISLAYEGEIPVWDAVYLNGSMLGPAVERTRDDTVSLMDFTTQAAAYVLVQRPSVLLLRAGTGAEMVQAIAREARLVVALESNDRLLSLMGTFADRSDSLFDDAIVRVSVTEPRAFLAADTMVYDMILHPVIGSFGGGAGIGALEEQYTLTVEAVGQMWMHLSDRGVLVFTAWMDYPYRAPLRLAATLVEALEVRGVRDVRKHLAAVRGWGTITFLVSKTPLSDADVIRLRAFCDRLFFDPALLPDLRPAERTQYNALDEEFFRYLDGILSPDRSRIIVSYPFDIAPATDDRPFFSQFLTGTSLDVVVKLAGTRAIPALELGSVLVVVTTVVVTLCAITLILLPLLRLRFAAAGKAWTITYFSSLGCAYMFFEIVLIQQFILFLGHPVYAAAAVMGGLLISSGAGSAVSGRFRAGARVLRNTTAAAAMVLLLYGLCIGEALRMLIPLAMPLKSVAALALVALPGFVMGMPFPLGLRHLDEHSPPNVPWAWGINAAMSVAAAGLATLLAVLAGFHAVLFAAAGGYILALLSTGVGSE